MCGTVKWFNEEKGYGFITGKDGKDYFIHVRDMIYDVLMSGQEVTFQIVNTERGAKAIDVKLL